MKAAYFDNYGAPETIVIKDIPTPEPKPDELRIRVIATAVTAADARIRAARFPKGFGLLARLAFGLMKPRLHVLGGCFSGVVEVVGGGVTEFAVGDEVCGMTGVSMGAHAEYVVVRETSAVAKKPAQVSHDDAAGLLFGGTTALYFVRNKAHVAEGESVLVNGASGAVGTNTVQLARYFGGAVTGITSSVNAELIRSLGAQATVDYKSQDIFALNERYDVIIDAVGNITPAKGKRLLSGHGRLALIVASLGQMIGASFDRRILVGSAPESKEDISFLLGLLAEGKLTVVIDSTYTLDQIAGAHAQVDSGSKKGNVIVRIG